MKSKPAAQAAIGASVLAVTGAYAAGPQAVVQADVTQAAIEQPQHAVARDVTPQLGKALKGLSHEERLLLKAQPPATKALETFKCAMRMMAVASTI